MIQVSVAIITFNEERNIERCLQSVQGLADEIVVVDSFSTDKTEAICSHYGVRFIKHAFEGHVEQKNYAVSQCSNNWVLSLDADEALSATLKHSIGIIKQNPNADGYFCNRATHFCGQHIRHCGWYPDPSLRFWNKTKGKWAGNNPHDKYYMNEGSICKHIDGDLLHFSYYSIEEHVEQINKFTSLSAQSKFERGKKSGILMILFAPLIRFVRMYILQRGFLDGIDGFIVCKISAQAVFLKYIKLYSLNKIKNRNQLIF